MASTPHAEPFQPFPEWEDAGGGEYGRRPLGPAIRHLIALARRHLWLIAGIVGATLAAALLYTMLQTPKYTAETSVQINDQREQVLGEELDEQASSAVERDVERFLNTQVQILNSRGLARRVAQRLELEGKPRFYAAMGVGPPTSEASERQRGEAVLGLLQENLAVDLPRNSRIAAIGFTSTDPAMSAEIANAFAEEFIQANLQRRFDSSSYARTFVSEQLEEARARLEESERELNAYARQAGLIRARDLASDDDNGTAASSVTASSLLQLNEAANQAQAERVVAESAWRAEAAAPLFSSQTVLANPTVQALMTRQAQLEAELKGQRERYLDDHPTVQRLETELASVRQRLQSTASEVRNSVRARFVAAQAAEGRLRAQVGQLQGETLAEQDRAVRYNTLAREADTNRELYDGLLERYRQLNAASGIAASNIAVIDRADAPLAPSSPNLGKNLALALLIGIGLAAIAVFVRDQLDDTVHVPEDIAAKIGLPLLGVVPRAADGDADAEMADPKSPIAEAYHSLRGALLHSTRAGLPKVILVTSSQATEGKSTTAFAIASGLARMGRTAVLVDADLRRPYLHRRIGGGNETGLSDLLVSHKPASSVIRNGMGQGLHFITSGPLPPSPTELLTSPRMAELLDELSASHDTVVLDSPPVIGLADAPVLSALAGGTVIVIEADRARGGALKAALRRLRAVNPLILGAVLTKFDPSKAANRFSEYYGYDYYRYDKDDAA